MAGTQRFFNSTNNTTTSFATPTRPISEGRTRSRTMTSSTQPITRQQAYRMRTHQYENNQHDDNDNAASQTMWRYSRQTSTYEQEMERRNEQKLQFTTGNNNQVNRRDEDEEDEEDTTTSTNANKSSVKNSLVKNSSSEDEGGEARPNKKIFPVLSEQDELFRKVRSVLNKVSSVNYTRLRKRWLSLMPKSTEEEEDGETHLTMKQLEDVIHMIILKALDDTIYMHIYAGLMGYVVARKPADISTRIRQLINSQLHHLLQRLATDKELALFHRSTQLVDATRRRKVTLHRFIAELYCEKACTSKFLYEKVTDLLIVNNPVDIDENIECLCVLVTFAGQKLEEVKKPMVEGIISKLVQRQNETPPLISKRIQFMILDLVEMKDSGWSPHNKWWSQSVQRAPERERTHSSPSPSTTTSQRQERMMAPLQPLTQEEPHQKVDNRPVVNKNILRSRTRSEGNSRVQSVGECSRNCGGTSSSSGIGEKVVPILTARTSTPKGISWAKSQSGEQQQTQYGQPQAQPEKQGQNQRNQRNRALMALLNKVSPPNVDRMAHQLYEVLTMDNFDETTNFIVDKILDDAFYISSYVLLIHRVSCKPNMKNFGVQICSRVMSILEKNPASKEGFQLLAELYKLNMVTFHQVRSAFQWLMDCPIEAISSAMESLVMFLFISGSKFEADVNDEVWMNGLIEFWERKAHLVAHNQGRPLCLLHDVIELRQSKWMPQRQPHWIPPTIDLPTVRFEPESLIRLFQSDQEEFLRFIKGETSSIGRIDKFWKDAFKYGVLYGDCEKDPEFLKMTGICLHTLLQKRILRREKVQNFIGYFVNEIVAMARVQFKAWDNFGLIMKQVF